MRAAGHRGVLALLLACAPVLPACDQARTPTFHVPPVFDLHHDPATGIREVDILRTDVLPAEALRTMFEVVFSRHGIALSQVMLAARRDDPQIAAWIRQLVDNTDEMTSDLGLIYGPSSARAFNQQWAQHTQFMVDYAVAIRNENRSAANSAEEKLRLFARDSGSFFETVTAEHADHDTIVILLPAATVQALLDAHIDHMLAMIDADARGDVAATGQMALDDNSTLSTIADLVVAAIVDQQPMVFPGSVSMPAVQSR